MFSIFNAQLILGKIKTTIEQHDFENIGKITIIQRASDAFNKEKGLGQIEIVL